MVFMHRPIEQTFDVVQTSFVLYNQTRTQTTFALVASVS